MSELERVQKQKDSAMCDIGLMSDIVLVNIDKIIVYIKLN